MQAGHGPNIGHGWVKYVVIGQDGQELPPVVFPAMIARAAGKVAGALRTAVAIDAGGTQWWVGEDALLSASPLTLLAQERLVDAAFIPALLRSALNRLGSLNGASAGCCVTGLPATWASDRDKARALGERLRQATDGYDKIRVIPEPLGLAYSVLLDNNGAIVGDTGWETGQIAVVDGGHHTLDLAVLSRLTPMPQSLETFQLGAARALTQIRARMTSHFERDFTLYEVDLAVRAGRVAVAGRELPLPAGWDRPLLDLGDEISRRMMESLGKGSQLQGMVLGGGLFAELRIADAVQQRYPFAVVAPDPQLAIARGYARLARRFAAAGV